MTKNLKAGDKIRPVATGYRKTREVTFANSAYILLRAGKAEKMITTEEFNRDYEIVSE